MKNRSKKPYFDEVEYQHFINAEIHAIEKSRFIESQKAHRDLRYDDEGNISNTHDSDWVLRHAKAFRQAWHDSACKTCVKVDECYECLKDRCEHYDYNPKWKEEPLHYFHKTIKRIGGLIIARCKKAFFAHLRGIVQKQKGNNKRRA